jgi:hypothetical protein
MREFSCLKQGGYHFNQGREAGKHLPTYPERFQAGRRSHLAAKCALLSNAASGENQS